VRWSWAQLCCIYIYAYTSVYIVIGGGVWRLRVCGGWVSGCVVRVVAGSARALPWEYNDVYCVRVTRRRSTAAAPERGFTSSRGAVRCHYDATRSSAFCILPPSTLILYIAYYTKPANRLFVIYFIHTFILCNVYGHSIIDTRIDIYICI